MSPTRQTLARLGLAVVVALAIGAATSHLVARWIGIPEASMAYRRIGPETGPQVFIAGSSLVQFGLSWPEVSAELEQGMENWGVGGSTPELWEISQTLSTNANRTLIGVSVYDMNEHRLCDTRANFVPIARTIRDLWASDSDWSFSKQLISQYPLAYLRSLFPTAGRSEAVLVGFRGKAREALNLASGSEDRARALVLPSQAILEFGESKLKLSELSEARLLRRLAMARGEIRGQHSFNGPKFVALKRMVDRAQLLGAVTVVVLPVSPAYAEEFLSLDVLQNFEAALAAVVAMAPETLVVRLDQLPDLQFNDYFSDLVHLNSSGRRIATEAFLKELRNASRQP